jgi:type I restriction enzyme S subunit
MSFSEWKTYKLNDICDVRDGTHDSPKQASQGYYLATSKHIKNGKLDVSTAYKISEQDYVKINKRSKVDKWDILFSMIGTIGETVIIKNEPDFAIKNVGLFKTKNEELSKWIYYYLKSPDAQNEIKSNYKGSTQQYISLTDLRNFPIILPSEKEYKNITSILSSLDDALELNQQINKTLEEMAKAIFKEWFVDFNFPNTTGKFQETEIGKIPIGWKVYTIGDLVDTISETYKFGKKEKVIFLNTGDILEGEFLHRNYSEIASLPGQAKKSIKRNDILFSEIRPANKRFAFVNFDADEYVVSTKLMVLRSKKTNPLLIYFLLTREEMLKQLQHLAESRSGTFPQITFSQLKDLKIALPNDETLDKFIKYLEAYYSQSKQIIEEIQSLISLRDTLLPKLMKGEIEIQEKETI